MRISSFILYGGLVRLGFSAYSIKDSYDSSNWLDMFTFSTDDDLTHGYVNYLDPNTAQQNGILNMDNNVVTLGVDHTSQASGRGRDSVRLTSTNQYNHGLVVLDLAHMPGSVCGSWPAFWMVGPDWPSGGEIDIIEGVNSQAENSMTMHTSDGCSFAGKNCKGNQGCSQTGGGSSSYGDGFNANNGGVYAMEWTSDHLDIWFFGRDNVPEGVSGDSPDPSGWGEPTTTFNGGDGCDIDSHFKDQRIVFDTTFCGDWAGQVFDQDSQCSALASNCEDFVKNNPQAFAESYWTVNSLKVYCQDDSGALPQPSFTSSISVPTNITYSVPTQPVSETSFPSESPVIATVVVTSGVVTETAPPTVITFTADANGFPSPPDPNSQFEDFRNHAHAKRDRRATRHLRKHVSGRSFKRV